MMARAAVVRSPTTDRLHSLNPKIKIVRISGKPKNFTYSSWKPTNNSPTLWESRNSTHTPRESHVSGKPKSYTLTSREPTNSPQTLWEPRNSAHPQWESHTSGKPRSYTLTSWEPSNFTSTPGKPQNSTHMSGKPRSIPDLIPLKTPTKERDQQKEDRASIQEIRHPSEIRNSRDNSEMHQEHIHQEKNADQTRKAKARLHVMFEKEYNNRCIEESIGILATVKGKGLGKRRKLSLSKHSYQTCYTCGKSVIDVRFEEHLFFGESECTQCNWKISSCEAFRENKMDQMNGNSTCPHNLRYCMTPSEYISKKLSQESPRELDRSKFTSYVRSLKQLKVSDPWRKAIDQCQNFLDRVTSQPSETNEEQLNTLDTVNSVNILDGETPQPSEANEKHLNTLEKVESVEFLEGETSQPSEANGDHLNASKSEAVFRVPEEIVPTSKHEIKNSPSLTHEDGDLILSQTYDVEHLNEVVEYEIARDYPEVRMERSPVLFTESSGKSMNTGSLAHGQTNTDTCSGNLVGDVASQSTSLSDTTETNGGTNSTRIKKGPKKTKRKPAKRFKSKPNFSRLQANNDAEKTVLETPSNGYYLIVRHAIEECPMCYTEFCPSRFTVNINTFLITTVCIGCDLTVYIVIDPPDGSAPKIFIETESGPSEKPKKK